MVCVLNQLQMMNYTSTVTWLVLAWLSAVPAQADQTQIPNNREARQLLWPQPYPNGGWTLYCGERF